MIWEIRRVLKCAFGANALFLARAGWAQAASLKDRREWTQSSGNSRGGYTQERRKAHWSPGKPRRRLGFILLRDLDIPVHPVAGVRSRAAGLVVSRARTRCTGTSRGQARGQSGARSPHRAYTRARTLHTHLELVPGGGRGGETKPVS